MTTDCGVVQEGSIRLNNIKLRVVANRIPDRQRDLGESK